MPVPQYFPKFPDGPSIHLPDVMGYFCRASMKLYLSPPCPSIPKTTQYFRAMAIPSTEKPSCRTDQFQLLSQYIPGPGYPLPEALVAQGLQGTGVIKHLIGSFFWLKMLKCLGKTATLQHHLASVNIPHAFIHCVEVYQPRLLFQVGGSSQEIAS